MSNRPKKTTTKTIVAAVTLAIFAGVGVLLLLWISFDIAVAIN